MPRGALIATLASLAACAPARFGWSDPDAAQRLARYLESFRAAAGEHFVDRMTRAELVRRLRRAPVLWLGDHHDDPRLHALQRDLLAELQRAGVPMAFALEAIGSQDQSQVHRYLRGERTLDELREAMRRSWPGSWLDDPELDPEHYRALLAFAREHGLPVAALEPTPRLPIERRDEHIALALRECARRFADRLLVVHVGQAHLLGDGDLMRRSGLGGIGLGAEPPPALLAAAPPAAGPGELWRSDGGLWWFGELLAGAGQTDAAAAAAARRATWPSTSSAATR